MIFFWIMKLRVKIFFFNLETYWGKEKPNNSATKTLNYRMLLFIYFSSILSSYFEWHGQMDEQWHRCWSNTDPTHCSHFQLSKQEVNQFKSPGYAYMRFLLRKKSWICLQYVIKPIKLYQERNWNVYRVKIVIKLNSLIAYTVCGPHTYIITH